MSKYTPGPWILSSNPKQILFKEEGHPYRLLAEAHNAVFRDGTGQGSLPDEEIEANARLIAAAPELLSVARLALSLKELAGKQDIGSQVQFQATLGNLFALSEIVIAKAEGRSNGSL